jgi:FkbM family methyltransferase
VLSPDIVRDLLPMRVRTLAARASLSDATARETRFAAVSDAYREALAAADAPVDELVRTDLQGLAWWVPVPRSVKGATRERIVAKQRFPYRNITQTREFAIGPVMLDIGANVGRMSIPRVTLGDIAHAYCAEPDPLNYAALVRNIADNGLRGLVLPDRVAIGSSTGIARLRHAKFSGGHHLERSGDLDGTVEVMCWRLDDWCERLKVDLDLVAYVKVDTQGWELDVLRGAPVVLSRRHIAWQLEVSPAALAQAGASLIQLYDICEARFSHFVDLSRHAEGPRARRTNELRQALAYLDRPEGKTDIILFNAAAGQTD